MGRFSACLSHDGGVVLRAGRFAEVDANMGGPWTYATTGVRRAAVITKPQPTPPSYRVRRVCRRRSSEPSVTETIIWPSKVVPARFGPDGQTYL